MADKNYNAALGATLSRKGIDQDGKKELVLSATGGRTDSIREMSNVEAINLLKSLNDKADNYDENREKKLKMKRKILAYCHEMNWETDDGKVDMKRVNGYCEKSGYLKKKFNDYKIDELPKLVQQFARMRANYLKK